jgi:plastocyanin
MKSSCRAVFALGIALSLLFFVEQGWAGESKAEVSLDHSHVQPARTEIKTGESVTFKNVVDMPGGHTVVADDGSFESPPLNKDQSWTHQFGKPGSYKFHLKQHPDTKGEIVVQ